MSLAALASYFLEHGKGQLQPGVTARLKTIEQDIGSLRQYDAELSSEVGFLLDSTVGLINFEQNQSMKMFERGRVTGCLHLKESSFRPEVAMPASVFALYRLSHSCLRL